MTRDELKTAIDTLFNGNQSRAARSLNISPRTMRAALTDPNNASYRPLGAGAADDLCWMLERFPNGVREVNPHETIEILQDHMVQMGWNPEEAAAGILGVATANFARMRGS